MTLLAALGLGLLIGTVLGAAGSLAAVAGSVLNRQVDQHVLLVGFAVVMVIAATGMLTGRRSRDAMLLGVAAYTGVHSGIQLLNPDTPAAAQPPAAAR